MYRVDSAALADGEAAIVRGRAVDVRFARRDYTGIVWQTGCPPPEDFDPSKVQPLTRVRTDLPLIGEQEMRLWEFIADYYLCTIGEVFKAAYPSMRINGEKAFAARLERLRARVARLQARLAKKHRANVEERLRDELDRVSKELSCLQTSYVSPQAGLENIRPHLLAGAGRMEEYRGLIRTALEMNLQVLVLTPEIAFCEKMAAALQEEFGHCLYCVNSARSAGAIQATAQALRSGAKALVVGTRSAVFLPFSRLGLCIVDEEQDSSFKQDEPAPRYNGRDCAVYLASLHGARCVLGSAFPSLESLLNVRSGKYTGTALPPADAGADVVSFIDIGAERRKRGMVGPLSRKLAEQVSSLPAEAGVLLLRGWEDAAVLEESIAALLGGRDVQVVTLAELKRNGTDGAAMIAVLQIEAFCPEDDFRGDEKALQMISMLARLAPRVVVQTSVPSRFDPERNAEGLLEERRTFNFPPFSRLVEVRRRGDHSLVQRHFLAKDRTLAARKREIALSVPDDCYIDVDPL